MNATHEESDELAPFAVGQAYTSYSAPKLTLDQLTFSTAAYALRSDLLDRARSIHSSVLTFATRALRSIQHDYVEATGTAPPALWLVLAPPYKTGVSQVEWTLDPAASLYSEDNPTCFLPKTPWGYPWTVRFSARPEPLLKTIGWRKAYQGAEIHVLLSDGTLQSVSLDSIMLRCPYNGAAVAHGWEGCDNCDRRAYGACRETSLPSSFPEACDALDPPMSVHETPSAPTSVQVSLHRVLVSADKITADHTPRRIWIGDDTRAYSAIAAQKRGRSEAGKKAAESRARRKSVCGSESPEGERCTLSQYDGTSACHFWRNQGCSGRRLKASDLDDQLVAAYRDQPKKIPANILSVSTYLNNRWFEYVDPGTGAVRLGRFGGPVDPTGRQDYPFSLLLGTEGERDPKTFDSLDAVYLWLRQYAPAAALDLEESAVASNANPHTYTELQLAIFAYLTQEVSWVSRPGCSDREVLYYATHPKRIGVYSWHGHNAYASGLDLYLDFGLSRWGMLKA